MKHRGKYPADWKRVAERVKAEADYRCARCRHPDHPDRRAVLLAGMGPCDDECAHPKDNKQRVLTVHHLDLDKSNCRWWNIPPLCQVCHLQIQGRVKMNQTYPFPHSPWFWPYVAGYYAFHVLGENLTREEVEQRLPELLAAGQPHLEDFYRQKVTC